MTLWLVRAGKHGEREALALDKGVAVIGWENMPDLAGVKQRQELEVSIGLPKPGDPDRRRTIVHGLKLFSETPRQG